mmetsp:Transcript_120901/g.375782  ORF Transcript_120901/g.375782 Transcript_120901/m.375782 type:complete len:423 (+) Transcript_120901:628-1896(+)
MGRRPRWRSSGRVRERPRSPRLRSPSGSCCDTATDSPRRNAARFSGGSACRGPTTCRALRCCGMPSARRSTAGSARWKTRTGSGGSRPSAGLLASTGTQKAHSSAKGAPPIASAIATSARSIATMPLGSSFILRAGGTWRLSAPGLSAWARRRSQRSAVGAPGHAAVTRGRCRTPGPTTTSLAWTSTGGGQPTQATWKSLRRALRQLGLPQCIVPRRSVRLCCRTRPSWSTRQPRRAAPGPGAPAAAGGAGAVPRRWQSHSVSSWLPAVAYESATAWASGRSVALHGGPLTCRRPCRRQAAAAAPKHHPGVRWPYLCEAAVLWRATSLTSASCCSARAPKSQRRWARCALPCQQLAQWPWSSWRCPCRASVAAAGPSVHGCSRWRPGRWPWATSWPLPSWRPWVVQKRYGACSGPFSWPRRN